MLNSATMLSTAMQYYFYSIPLLPQDTLLRQNTHANEPLKNTYADSGACGLSEGVQDMLLYKDSNLVVFISDF